MLSTTKLLMNNMIYTITDDIKTIERILTDDDFVTSYIITQVEKGAINLHGTETLEIQRPATSASAVDFLSSHSASYADQMPCTSTSHDNIPSTSNKEVAVWQSKGQANETDTKATELLLKLRGSDLNLKKFKDKSSVKLKLWEDIARKMQHEGFSVTGIQCRQKFLNLSKKYIGFCRHVHQTGVEKKDPPDFYDDLHKILGDKDKVTLDNIMDSIEFPEKSENEKSNIDKKKETSKIKLKPPSITKAAIVQTIKECSQQQQETQSQQFKQMFTLLEDQNNIMREQNKGRNKLIDLFAASISNKKRKRRHSSESSDE